MSAFFRGYVWTLSAQVIPMLVGLTLVPAISRNLGAEKLGLLSLAWVAIGYFGVFDLGLSRALTQQIAKRLGQPTHGEIRSLFLTSTVMLLVLGLLGGLVVFGLTPWIILRFLKVSQSLRPDALRVFHTIAFAIPVVLAFASLKGLCEAFRKFDRLAQVSLPLGVLNFVLPFLLSAHGAPIGAIVLSLLLARTGAALALVVLSVRELLSQAPGRATPNRAMAVSLLRFGGWVTVTNIVGPIITYMDRFLLGSLVSVTAVAYYAVPYDAVTRLVVIASALAAVLFPTFSTELTRRSNKMATLYWRSLIIIAAGTLPLFLGLVLGANRLLETWLGRDFADQSSHVLQVLAIGVFLNGLAQIPYSLIQAGGRPDLTGKLHVLELPIYVAMAWTWIRASGISGASLAWTVRVAIDTVMLMFLAHQQLTPKNR